MQEEPECIQGLRTGLLPKGSQETRKGGWGHSSPPLACYGRQKRWPSCSQHLGPALSQNSVGFFPLHFSFLPFWYSWPKSFMPLVLPKQKPAGLCLDWGSVTLIFGWRSLLKIRWTLLLNTALLHHCSSVCHPPWFEDCWRCKKIKIKTNKNHS